MPGGAARMKYADSVNGSSGLRSDAKPSDNMLPASDAISTPIPRPDTKQKPSEAATEQGAATTTPSGLCPVDGQQSQAALNKFPAHKPSALLFLTPVFSTADQRFVSPAVDPTAAKQATTTPAPLQPSDRTLQSLGSHGTIPQLFDNVNHHKTTPAVAAGITSSSTPGSDARPKLASVMSSAEPGLAQQPTYASANGDEGEAGLSQVEIKAQEIKATAAAEGAGDPPPLSATAVVMGGAAGADAEQLAAVDDDLIEPPAIDKAAADVDGAAVLNSTM